MRHDPLKDRASTARDLAAHIPMHRMPGLRAIIAIPVRNEEDRIGPCLEALRTQRTLSGTPLPAGTIAIVLVLNNCSDRTAQVTQALRVKARFPLHACEIALPPLQANAGFARGLAMDVAALWLEHAGHSAGAILTTDADSRVPPHWVARSLARLSGTCGAVAGRVVLEAAEQMNLPPALVHRQTVEADYERALLHLAARIDPLAHDPWPNHQTASGASYGLHLAAYRSIGGLPDAACGEDRALARALRRRDIRIRHDPELVVTTSARLDGRAVGGASDTMRRLCAQPDAPADLALEAVQSATRRFVWRRRLRMWHAAGTLDAHDWRAALRLGSTARLPAADLPFGAFWDDVEALSPRLVPIPLRPSRMPAHAAAARALVKAMARPAIPEALALSGG